MGVARRIGLFFFWCLSFSLLFPFLRPAGAVFCCVGDGWVLLQVGPRVVASLSLFSPYRVTYFFFFSSQIIFGSTEGFSAPLLFCGSQAPSLVPTPFPRDLSCKVNGPPPLGLYCLSSRPVGSLVTLVVLCPPVRLEPNQDLHLNRQRFPLSLSIPPDLYPPLPFPHNFLPSRIVFFLSRDSQVKVRLPPPHFFFTIDLFSVIFFVHSSQGSVFCFPRFL